MSEIEFRNNGSKDSLTGAPTIMIFIEFLEREIALRSRLREPLSLLMVSIPRVKDAYQIFLLNQSIRSVLRKEDFYCRASEDGFWIAMRADGIAANQASKRFEKSFRDTFTQDQTEYPKSERLNHLLPKMKIETLQFKPGTKSKIWLTEIDEKYFSQ